MGKSHVLNIIKPKLYEHYNIYQSKDCETVEPHLINFYALFQMLRGRFIYFLGVPKSFFFKTLNFFLNATGGGRPGKVTKFLNFRKRIVRRFIAKVVGEMFLDDLEI